MVADGLLYQNCHELLSFQDVPIDNVRPHLPQRYGRDPHGDNDASFYVSTRVCERVTVGGVEVGDAIDSHLSVFVDPPKDEPDPPHASSQAPGVPLDVYLVQWVTTNAPHATWMKQNTGLGERVKLVDGLAFDIVDHDFTVVVPRPAPSPSHIEATAHEPSGCPRTPTGGAACPVPGFIAENW